MAALTLASLVVSPPAAVGAEGDALAALYASQRGRILAAMYLGTLAWSGAFVAYAAALERMLGASGDGTTALFARVGFGGAIVNAAIIVLSVFIGALAVTSASDRSQLELLRAGSFLANAFTGFATAVCVGGFGPALRRAGFPRWLVVLSAAVGLHHLLSAAALGRSGLWSPSGAISTTAPLGMTLWVASVAALAWGRRQ